MDSLAIDCMLKQIEKDTIIVSRGRRIESLKRVVKLDSALLSTQRIEIDVLQEDNNKMNIKIKKTPKKLLFTGILGLIFGLLIP